MNSIFGPPTNLAITPDERLALVANSVNWVQDGAAWKPAPDNKVYVFDLEASPPASDRDRGGGEAAVRAWRSTRAGILRSSPTARTSPSAWCRIQGMDVKLVDTVAMGDEVAAVAITPDGKRALAVKFPRAQGRGARHRRAEGDL